MDANKVLSIQPVCSLDQQFGHCNQQELTPYVVRHMVPGADDTDQTPQLNPPRNLPPGLAILPKKSDICAEALPVLDPESIERFCRVWAEVGRDILLRRKQTK